MSKKILSVHSLFLILLSLMLALACIGCASKSSATAEIPQSGGWTGEFSTKSGDQDKHWVVNFQVSEDGKTATSIQLAYYFGELESNTQIALLLSGSKHSIENNSFSVTIPEFYNYTSHSYEGKVAFTSKDTADGTFKIDDTEYKWMAAPIR